MQDGFRRSHRDRSRPDAGRKDADAAIEDAIRRQRARPCELARHTSAPPPLARDGEAVHRASLAATDSPSVGRGTPVLLFGFEFEQIGVPLCPPGSVNRTHHMLPRLKSAIAIHPLVHPAAPAEGQRIKTGDRGQDQFQENTTAAPVSRPGSHPAAPTDAPSEDAASKTPPPPRDLAFAYVKPLSSSGHTTFSATSFSPDCLPLSTPRHHRTHPAFPGHRAPHGDQAYSRYSRHAGFPRTALI